jgi:hypothetical protein
VALCAEMSHEQRVVHLQGEGTVVVQALDVLARGAGRQEDACHQAESSGRQEPQEPEEGAGRQASGGSGVFDATWHGG